METTGFFFETKFNAQKKTIASDGLSISCYDCDL